MLFRLRFVVAVLLVGALAAAMVWTHADSRDPRVDPPTMSWIATAHQFGPVSYRDPAGAISPDGRWIAYSEGRFLRVRPVGGGPSVEFPPGAVQIRHLVWSPDNRTIVADGNGQPGVWAVYDRVQATRRPLSDDATFTASLRQLTWSPDGREIAAIANGREGFELWTFAADGSNRSAKSHSERIAWPAWTPRGEIACIATTSGRARVTIPCGGAALVSQPDADAYGPMAFSPDGATVYVSMANASGTVDLWSLPTTRGTPHRLSNFARDAYAPSVAADGSILFKVQSYRTAVAVAPSGGGPSHPLATFQSETPSWDPTGRWIGITYGTWRRVPDDARYPDIAQDAGIVAADEAQPAAAPAKVVHDSASEDQSLCWSPNGRWIAFHSHKEQSDDIWLKPAEGSAEARRITTLGRGAEAGWPRWSADGRSLLFTGASRTTHRNAVYIVGMDQDAGAVSAPAREVEIRGLDADVLHAEWMGRSTTIVGVAKEAPGRHLIFTVPSGGGTPHLVHRFASEHDFPGLGSSPDGTQVAFIAPAADGFFQVFALPIAGGTPRQVTTDPSNKTQPAWSPDGARIAFTVWNYDAQFFQLKPAGSAKALAERRTN